MKNPTCSVLKNNPKKLTHKYLQSDNADGFF